MKTIIKGYDHNHICITTSGVEDIIDGSNSIIRLWLSSGTILGMKYGSKLFPNKWIIQALYGPVGRQYIYRQAVYGNDDYDTDLFETEEEVVNYKVIPNAYYNGKEIGL
jgi:hypothetical protein